MEILYNGIQLPDQWPPQNMDPGSRNPMPIPYLEHPPEVISIDVGRQLFVDDFLIDHTTLTRTFHTVEKYAGNPVLKAETEEELGKGGTCYLGHGGVFYDPQDQLFKMFYTAGWRGGLALATSKDAIHWERPNIGESRRNLLIPPGENEAGLDNSVWLDIDAETPAERLKFLTQRGKVHTLHTSSDGLTWSDGVETGESADYCSFFYNPFRKVWVYSIKRDNAHGRCRYYAESKDFLEGAAKWDDAVYWTGADNLDKPDPHVGDQTQLYSLNAVAYESLFIGMFYIHRGPDNSVCDTGKFPKLTDLTLGYSRDGFHWDRPDRNAFLAASREEGNWERGYLHSTTGVFMTVGDKLIFPYCGYSGIAPDGSRGAYQGGSIGLAFLRRDGFASMNAEEEVGTLTTRPVCFQGKQLKVNVDCPLGVLRVEVLDEDGKPIEPFTTANCIPVSVDSTLQEIFWSGVEDLSVLNGKSVKIRFHLTFGKLYSFGISS
ncbi:glycosyl hydrolase family 32 [Paenibacillus sp. LMG 31461]|uniref:Glycosyl hydrolase family 32 n=1 Tax=Paenibacillus plantarum TaxID=2654975 RepID=A0ABX1XCD1_9BACL|nr:glycosyl hydrolase family 32 [Paenibacillus plantarum]NOU66074.1 glycosyl hydrolase family 32 [Paenibacillus plantarum]